MSLDGLEEDDPGGRLVSTDRPRRGRRLLAYGSSPVTTAALFNRFVHHVLGR